MAAVLLDGKALSKEIEASLAERPYGRSDGLVLSCEGRSAVAEMEDSD
jgi:hypothetical protein